MENFLKMFLTILLAKGCKLCARNQPKSIEKILKELQIIHQSFYYFYDVSSLERLHSTIIAKCSVHGCFSVRLERHLKGAGCPFCTGHFIGTGNKLFAIRANKVHNNRYSYGNYTSAHKHMEITCKTYGIFYQSPASHLQGHGCNQCSNEFKKLNSKGGYTDGFFILHPNMKDIPAIFYIIEFFRDKELSFLKIGVTRTTTKLRFKSGYRKYKWNIVQSLYNGFLLEKETLEKFKEFQVFPKQHNFVGKTECLDKKCETDLL